MKELVLIALYFAHLASAVLWVGGIIFILFFAMPSSRQVLGAESGKLMGEISKRFTPMANLSIILLVVTGALLAVFSRQFAGFAVLENDWAVMLVFKLLLVAVMVGVHFYRGLVLTPRVTLAGGDGKAALQRLSMNLVRLNLALGLLVLLMSGALSLLRGY